jgi:hypothetical protein
MPRTHHCLSRRDSIYVFPKAKNTNPNPLISDLNATICGAKEKEADDEFQGLPRAKKAFSNSFKS